MTVHQAKLVLQAYRPGSADEFDPHFREALDLTRTDPGLATWWKAWTAVDHQLIRAHDNVVPPSELRAQILAAHARERNTAPSVANPLIFPSWIGFAAAVALAILGGIKATPTTLVPASDSPLAAFAIEDAQHPETHGGKGEAMKNLNRVLKLPTTRLSDRLPVDFELLRDTGCRKLNLGGRDVLEVCFKRNGPGLHCYMVRRKDFPELSAPEKPTISDKPQASIATWSDEKNVYIVVTSPDHNVLEKVL